MESRWSEQAAQSFVEQYAEVGEELALRVYTSRLLGADPRLVMQGGGNTSVKLVRPDVFGEPQEVLAVKGSGFSLKTIEPEGFPLLWLEPCRRLRELEALSDRALVNELRRQLLEHRAPNPSVEALLHAFLPHKFVDHTHPGALLSIVDQPNARALCEDIFGPEWGIVDYIMPGFSLFKRAAEVYAERPEVKGLILLQHGLFTFGESAKESYLRHVEAVTKAEAYLQTKTRPTLSVCVPILPQAQLEESILPLIRGAYQRRSGRPWVFYRSDSVLARDFANSEEALSWSQRGPVTPDHVLHTKPWPLLLRDLSMESPESLNQAVETALDAYQRRYQAYLDRHRPGAADAVGLTWLPRVLLVQGLGLLAAGQDAAAAKAAGSLYERTIEIILDAMAVGDYTPVSEADIFDMEVWPLEQAKLGDEKPPLLQGKVAYITGAASGIGLACARTFGAAGAALYLIDLNEAALEEALKALQACGIAADGEVLDVTSQAAVQASFRRILRRFGGVDVVISNAGAAFQGEIAELPMETLEASMALNFYSHQYVASCATQIMKRQGYGGSLLFNVSKAALNPGAKFGPYAIAKAATLALVKQYALEYGRDGIRANALNADRVRTGLFTDDFVKQRAAARNIEPDEYFRANLLRREVYAKDVADAFLHLALAEKTTAMIFTVDGGNIAASPR